MLTKVAKETLMAFLDKVNSLEHDQAPVISWDSVTS